MSLAEHAEEAWNSAFARNCKVRHLHNSPPPLRATVLKGVSCALQHKKFPPAQQFLYIHVWATLAYQMIYLESAGCRQEQTAPVPTPTLRSRAPALRPWAPL